MSRGIFSIQEHVILGSYVRHYPKATRNARDTRPRIAIKQYTPLDNRDPRPGDVTIIGAHANGFPKELYEPLWDDLYHQLKQKGVRIRSIWITDAAWQGQSAVLNETELGLDPGWFDTSRDLFLMVNHFAADMPRPIVGVGHSMGATCLVQLSLMHPRLFTSLIMMDPMYMSVVNASGGGLALASSRRRDVWPSREAARTAFLKSKFYQAWDPRVLDAWIEHGLRELPTELIQLDGQPSPSPPSSQGGSASRPVTLTTTRHQEVASFARPNPQTASHPNPGTDPDRETHADVDPTIASAPIYRPEIRIVAERLPAVLPSVLYVFGGNSPVSVAALRAAKMETTGVGVGGSGGAAHGRVKEVIVPDCGHLVPMEKVGETAAAAADWIAPEMERFARSEERVRRELEALPGAKQAVLSDGFLKVLADAGKGLWSAAPAPEAKKAKL